MQKTKDARWQGSLVQECLDENWYNDAGVADCYGSMEDYRS